MSNVELNSLLYRPVMPAGQFAGLFPDSKCKSEFVGEGMTDFSMKSMAELVETFYKQAAKAAPLLEGEDLQETCDKIHYFLYNWFQYDADDADQMLRTPACSWASRYKGIDCKSYSILASSLLTCLGISHYLRRVKQPGYEPEMWTHVYVVVPKDQDNAALSKGYFVIDGTVPMSTEAPYVQNDDLYMSGMNHFWLKGAANNPAGLNGSVDWTKLKSMLFPNGFSFSQLTCIGGSWGEADLNAVIEIMTQAFQQRYDAVNMALEKNSIDLYNAVYAITELTYKGYDHAVNTDAYNFQSACSEKAGNGYKALMEYYKNIYEKAFLPYLKNYFDIALTPTTTSNMPPIDTQKNGKGPRRDYFNRSVTFNIVGGFKLKAGVTQINAFELNAYTADPNAYKAGFNVNQMLNSFTDTLAYFGSPKNTNTGSSTPVNNAPVNSTPVNNTPVTTGQQSGNTTTYDTSDDDTTTPATPKKDNGSSNTLAWIAGIGAVGIVAKLLFFSGAAGLTGPKPTKTKK